MMGHQSHFQLKLFYHGLKPITVDNLTGNVVALELRYVGAEWSNQAIVHIELCESMPQPKRWQERRKGKWIESHATYKKV